MEIKGKITDILQASQGVSKSGKEWMKQEYVLETLEQFPRTICFSLWGETIKRYALKRGDIITAQIDLESREYNRRWYTDVKAYRVTIEQQNNSQPDNLPF